ncbi:MAG: hypothetical protein HYS98_05200, partial [Deltaproteobacteria bacterium]|nr:hypothetical protein [Deltaproteobacteria bacterium]
MLKDKFSVVVIGQDLLSYIIALELSLKKQDVCLVAPPLQKYPSLYLRDSSYILKKLGKLGISQYEIKHLFLDGSCFQVLSPHFRLDCTPGVQDLSHELQREFNHTPNPHHSAKFLEDVTSSKMGRKQYREVRTLIERPHTWTEKLSFPFSPLAYFQNFFSFQKDGTYVNGAAHGQLIKIIKSHLHAHKIPILELHITNARHNFKNWILNLKNVDGTLFTQRIVSALALNYFQKEKKLWNGFEKSGEYAQQYSTKYFFNKLKKPEGIKDHFLYIFEPNKNIVADNIFCAHLSETKKECQLDISFLSE